jgi:hypothetical protein
LSIKITDDDEIGVLGRHEFIVPPREVGHLGNQALHVSAELFNNFGVGL